MSGVRDLTKWPRLLVVGRDVTEDQASEILIRTDSWYVMSNDKAWEDAVYEAAGLDRGNHGWPTPEARWEFRAAHGVLPLSYLNNARIASSWVGGPHGWCSWSGKVSCSTFNIGKWPSHDGITEEWSTIAAAFPYLDLTAQLVADEGEGQVAGQWTVRNGSVAFDPEPTERIRPVDELDESHLMARFTSPLGERGVTIERLTEALRQVRTAVAVA